jgi:hypothetical protein
MFGEPCADELAVLIAQRHARAKEVRILAVGGPAKVRRMATGAIRLVERLAANEDVLRRNGTRELGEAPGAAPASATTFLRRRLASASAARRRLPLRGRSLGLPLTLRRLSGWRLRPHETARPRARKNDNRDHTSGCSHGVTEPPSSCVPRIRQGDDACNALDAEET